MTGHAPLITTRADSAPVVSVFLNVQADVMARLSALASSLFTTTDALDGFDTIA